MSEHKWESPISDEQIGFVPSCVICGAEFGTSTKTCSEYMSKMTEDMAKFIPAPPIDWQARALKAEAERDELASILNEAQHHIFHQAHCKILNTVGWSDLLRDGKPLPECNCKRQEIMNRIKACGLAAIRDEIRKGAG